MMEHGTWRVGSISMLASARCVVTAAERSSPFRIAVQGIQRLRLARPEREKPKPVEDRWEAGVVQTRDAELTYRVPPARRCHRNTQAIEDRKNISPFKPTTAVLPGGSARSSAAMGWIASRRDI